LRLKHSNKIIIATLNINSICNKFEQLITIVRNKVDILVITETKLDTSFPESQFLMHGYSKPYRFDRNRNGGGVMIFVREDIPSKLLNFTNSKNMECLFLEINLR